MHKWENCQFVLSAGTNGNVSHESANSAASDSPEEMTSVVAPNFSMANPNRNGAKAWPMRAGAASVCVNPIVATIASRFFKVGLFYRQ
jgi:hypothetical protein